MLGEGRSRIGTDPELEVVLPAGKAPPLAGTATLAGGVVTLSFEPAAGATFGGQRVTVRVMQAGDIVVMGTLRLDLLRRDGEVVLRVKDEDSDLRRGFAGIVCFPTDPGWRIAARFEPLDSPRTFELDFGDGAAQAYSSPGMVAFEREGATHRLFAMTERDRLFVLFKDLTNRDATYGAGRFLYAAPPADAVVTLDFNKAFNPPCAYNEWTTCPLPPRENRLALRVEAGERLPPAQAAAQS